MYKCKAEMKEHWQKLPRRNLSKFTPVPRADGAFVCYSFFPDELVNEGTMKTTVERDHNKQHGFQVVTSFP